MGIRLEDLLSTWISRSLVHRVLLPSGNTSAAALGFPFSIPHSVSKHAAQVRQLSCRFKHKFNAAEGQMLIRFLERESAELSSLDPILKMTVQAPCPRRLNPLGTAPEAGTNNPMILLSSTSIGFVCHRIRECDSDRVRRTAMSCKGTGVRGGAK